VAVVAVILAGFMFVTAHGDEEKIKTAKKILLYAVIGMVILLGARMISEVIINTVTSVDNASK
jgi:type IV secretory pathway VirB2 component (pilin)